MHFVHTGHRKLQGNICISHKDFYTFLVCIELQCVAVIYYVVDIESTIDIFVEAIQLRM